jgi:hypothetical protein
VDTSLVLTTIGTDGVIDYVEFPDGVRYALGAVSVLDLLRHMFRGHSSFHSMLDEFNKTREVFVSMDPVKFFEFLRTKKVRRVSSLIGYGKRTLKEMEGMSMSNFEHALRQAEEKVQSLGGGRKQASALDVSELRSLVAKLHFHDYKGQDENKDFYNLDTETVDSVDDGWAPPKEATHPLGKTAKKNAEKAEEALDKIEETEEKIEKLASLGRKFNAKQAKEDLQALAEEIAEIAEDEEMDEDEAAEKLQKSAGKVAFLHSVFKNAR